MTRAAQHTRDSVSFTVPGSPVALQRARLSTRGGFARAYDPAKNRDAKAAVAAACVQLMMNAPMDGALGMRVSFYVPKPKSKQRKNSDPYPHPTSRPDLDNYVKLVLDGMNGIVYNDDAQVVSIEAHKHWAQREPFTSVCVFRLTV